MWNRKIAEELEQIQERMQKEIYMLHSSQQEAMQYIDKKTDKQFDERTIEILNAIKSVAKEDNLQQMSENSQKIQEMIHRVLFEECYDIHERLVHIEDKINEIMDWKLQDGCSPNQKIPDGQMKVHFIRCIDWKNTGDMNCDPLTYFPELGDKYDCVYHSMHEIRWELIGKDDWIILGGGGVFGCMDKFQEAINCLLELSSHVIAWACGHNTHYDRTMNTELLYGRFYRLTTRDYGIGMEYLPDVSCMMPQLEKAYKKRRDIGIVEHFEFPITEFAYERISNTYSVQSIVRFIGESDVVITNTWHGSYWALLMGKKVIIYHPFSSRFEHYKYKPVLYSGSLEEDIGRAERYTQALWEAREQNIRFAQEIKSAILGDCGIGNCET